MSLVSSSVRAVADSRFDYSQLSPDVHAEAMDLARDVRASENQHKRLMTEIGVRLIAIKQKMGHGLFGAWILDEFGWAERTAQRYMQYAATPEYKSATVADLPLPVKTLDALTAKATPAAIREKFFEMALAGERVAHEQVVEEVRQAREADKKARADAKLKPAQRSYRKRKERDYAKEDEERRQLNAEKDAAAQAAVKFLMDKLGDDFQTFADMLAATDLYRVGRIMVDLHR